MPDDCIKFLINFLLKLFYCAVAKEDHSQSDCLVCCFLTHGEDNCLYAKDTSYLFDTVISSLAGTKCPTLIGKPKIFIVQVHLY